MTPAERDRVRAMANAPCVPTCTEHGACIVGRAILRYVPPGDFAAPGFVRVDPRRDGWPAHVVDRHPGCEYVITIEEARARGLALLAAADAAEEF